MVRASLLLALTLSCAPARHAAPPIRIFAASSLTDAISTAVDTFESAHPGLRIVAQYGSSSDLARQIVAGAPADLLFSADRRELERLAADGSIVEGTVIDLLSNTLVVVAGPGGPETIRHADELTSLSRVAMADPEAVPAGVYAREYLESVALWSGLNGKIVPTLDVRAALAAVASGNVEAGFVYRTDAAMEERVRVVFAVPPEEGPPIRYSLGIVVGSDRADVRSFYDFLSSDSGAGIFDELGFIVSSATLDR